MMIMTTTEGAANGRGMKMSQIEETSAGIDLARPDAGKSTPAVPTSGQSQRIFQIHNSSTDRGHSRETSEERRQRKAAKASAKEASRRANAEAALDLYGQGAGDDLGGSSQFVWHKKRQADASKGLSASESTARDEARRSEAQMEIEKLNRRRVEREREQTEREQEAARNAVASEDQAMRAWIAKEDEFYLQQSKKRAEIRVRERRAKPVDYLALNLKWSTQDSSNSEDEQDQGEGLDVDLEEPYAIFEVRQTPVSQST